MLSKRFGIALTAAAGLLIGVWLATRLAQRPNSARPTSGSTTLSKETNSPPPSTDSLDNSNRPLDKRDTERFAAENPDLARLREVAQALRTSKSPEESRRRLAVLRAHLASLEPAAASRAIREFLDSKADAPTQLGFKIGADGRLDESPTFRVFLLEAWAQMDLKTAAAYAERILSSRDSPDEWAVSLRNYAWGKPATEARPFLQEKLREMILYEPWQREPSAGFLEAFDVAVHVGGTDLMPPLTGLLRKKDNQAVAHAAYLALDRLTIQDPAAALGKLMDEPESMRDREVTRANYFARADVRDEQQRQLLEKYLLSSQITANELNAFAGIYPNANYMLSQNLLTKTSAPNRDTLVKHDAAALKTVEAWLSDPRFEKVKPILNEVSQRLRTFVRAAQANR